jgi:hypothetical protein
MALDNKEVGSLIVVFAGLLSTYTAWVLGGKQGVKNNTNESITKSTDQIVETSSKLLKTFEKMVEDERQHRVNCENTLNVFKLEIEELKNTVEKMKVNINCE